MSTIQTSRDYQRVAQAIEFIQQNAEQQPGLAQLAEHLGVSPFHLQRLFKRWVGVSPKQFLQEVTLFRARELLAQNRSILDASLAVGLSGPSRLHDHFVAIEAVTPGEFKSGGAGLTIGWGLADSVFGPIFLAVAPKGICQLAFVDEDWEYEFARLKSSWPSAMLKRDDAQAASLAAKMFDASRPANRYSLWVKGTNFQLQVWRALLAVPQGKVIHYQALATHLGRQDATRAVANAVAANPIGYLIPCHRVLRKSGHLGGYRWGPTRKNVMLGWEAAKTASNESV